MSEYLETLVKFSKQDKLIYATKPWLRAIEHIKNIEKENQQLTDELEETTKQSIAWQDEHEKLTDENKELREIVKIGNRMAMALTDAQSGYVCEYRIKWDDAVEALAKQGDSDE